MLEEYLDCLCGIVGLCCENIWIIQVVFMDHVGITFGLSKRYFWIMSEDHLDYLSSISGLCRMNIWII